MNKSRKQFILSEDVVCNNWNWSWSFTNHEGKMIVSGARDFNTDNDKSLIVHKNWEYKNSRRQSGYSQAIEHLELLDQGYSLYTFHQENVGDDEDEPRIGEVDDSILKTYVKHDGEAWYAYPNVFDYLPDEIGEGEEYFGGARNLVAVNLYRRNKGARGTCIKIHGYKCKACNFDFGKKYGDHGKGFIRVHHTMPLNMIGKRYKVNPEHDLVPLCPNYHAMVHRFKNNELDLEKLKELISSCK